MPRVIMRRFGLERFLNPYGDHLRPIDGTALIFAELRCAALKKATVFFAKHQS